MVNEKAIKKKSAPWYQCGLGFECLQCGACCSGPDEGYIWVTKREVELIADFLKIMPDQFRKRYLKRVGLRSTFIEQPVTKDCAFLKTIDGNKRCVIYTVRPNQCRTWPFWASNLKNPNSWNEAAKKCPGINRGKIYDHQTIEQKKKQKKWWPDE